ncbi:hypothetical protein HMPREF1557_02188 [Streptococcus sobrinus W1703]|uniref:Uncharacterized protein n=1 Tax=Streptococcus sobrinus W1703 TaxID=1227275 RepID=U2KFZ2_9STRE|nr:hypothetical protein HMPREF1557_02188 [Streptococcus sobrinus W1703]
MGIDETFQNSEIRGIKCDWKLKMDLEKSDSVWLSSQAMRKSSLD